MQSNTNPNGNPALSAKPAYPSPDVLSQPASQPGPGPVPVPVPVPIGPITGIAGPAHPSALQFVPPPLQLHHNNNNIDPDLDSPSHPLLHHAHVRTAPPGLPSDIMQRIPPTAEELGPVSNPPPPATAMAAQGIIAHEPDEAITDGRKAKRELSQSKRAAQNRAAQRAFRQRKEHYIKKLEQQVRDYTEMEHTYKVIQNDNYALREYVIQLQSRLLDLQVEPPLPPPNVNIAPPGGSSAARQPHSGAPVEAPANTTAAGTLADVAAAVAGLRAREPGVESNYPKPPTVKAEPAVASHDNDDIRRQLEADGLPPPSMRP